ncbi:MAG: carboxymuconolactone decarboxylase family protein [Crocinitomicaceae bacterium]
MTYIKTGVDHPGIVELMFYKGSTGKALANLVHTLMHGPSGLTSGERELIASYVSKLNDCEFCHGTHSASASVHLSDNGNAASCVIENIDTSPVSDKMKSLLKIAGKVQRSGREVSQVDVDEAKNKGATDEDVHDAVLIASAFCMYNRYVDGLGTDPGSPEDYPDYGIRLAKKGYKYPPLFLRKFVVRMINRQSRKRANEAK